MNKSYEDLRVWQQALDLAEHIYAQTRKFPKEESYGLISQMRRSAISIASNIAEGCARNSYGEFIQFLGIATGSLAELNTQLFIALRVGYIDKDTHKRLREDINAIGKMLNALKNSIKEQKSSLVTSNG